MSFLPANRRRISSIRSPVPSEEAPSTNTISVCDPIDGIRLTAASMFPTSLRQGTMTLQLSGQSCGRGRLGRATTIVTAFK